MAVPAKEADGSSATIAVTATHVFDTPGTYFPAFRVGAHRDGSTHLREAVRNLARVRVVVSE